MSSRWNIVKAVQGAPSLVWLCSEEENEALLSAYKKVEKEALPFTLVTYHCKDWDADYSPYPADLGSRHFAGKLPETLQEIESDVLPEVRKLSPARIDIGGYSLSALSALHLRLTTDHFSHCAALSGSLWYPGWIDTLQSAAPSGSGRVYLSLGKAEVKTRSALFRSNGALYEQVQCFFAEHYGPENVIFEWNNGNHGFEVDRRIEKALRFLYCGQ